MIEKQKKKPIGARVKALKKRVELASHTFIRARDSIDEYEIKGYCITCGQLCSSGNFQCGHYEPSSTCGLWLRYHPHNMHGQGGFCCNINRHGQQKMGNEYTIKMIDKYGLEYVTYLRKQKDRWSKKVTEEQFYTILLELYKKGNENEIVTYLETL